MYKTHGEAFSQLEEATISQLQEGMSSGLLTAERLAELYLARIEAIDRRGPALNSVIEINPDALEIARALDRERAESGARGPLHGIPIGITFIGRAYCEPTLIKLAYAFEQATRARHAPRYLPRIP